MSEESAEKVKVDGAPPSPERMKRELEEEFNVQRAKMKDLFLQKEDELRKLHQEKEHLESEALGLRAQLQQLQTLTENQRSEIESLQLLVNETVEASSSGTEEARRLRARNLQLEHLLGQMRQQQQQQEVSLAPATIVRNIARKLTADVDEHTHKKSSADESERSLIEPLEQEIAALKHKLRDTDAQLQDVLKSKGASNAAPAAGDTSTEPDGGGGVAEGARRCDMCVNYEKQLVCEQARAAAAISEAHAGQLALKQATEELEGVRRLHEETVVSWRGERAASGARLEELQARVQALQHDLEGHAARADHAAQRALHHVTHLTVQRETLHKKLDKLEQDNAMLIGQYLKKAEEMQNEIIDLPDNVEELQELTLRLREQLIFCQIGREEAAAAERDLRAQLLEHAALLNQQDGELNSLRNELRDARDQLDRLQTEREQMKELGDKLRHSNDMIEQLLEDKKRLQGEVCETRGRVAALQRDLDTSEKVQKDFVRLSQSLQVQLQRIREADTEVRWQHEEDVTQCPACHIQLNNNKKKVHCRHCGRIFCGACVCHEVRSGPRGAPSRVCAVCRTLLQPHTKPYFCNQPPHSPD